MPLTKVLQVLLVPNHRGMARLSFPGLVDILQNSLPLHVFSQVDLKWFD